jgi:metallo-beta-lactamase class B
MKRIFATILITTSILTNIQANQGDTITINNDIQLIHLCDSVFMHTTFDFIGAFGRVASNGMLVIKNKEAILIDTPASIKNTEEIASFLKEKWGISIKILIIGHYHEDCMGGINYTHSQGIKSIANTRTIAKCRELNLPIPNESFSDSLVLNFNGEPIICRYFGAGHTIDNITVWVPQSHILFGGCLIKSADSKGLGNLADALVDDWGTTVEKIIAKYSIIKYVVPGHGSFGGPELLTHTVSLVKAYKAQYPKGK